MRRIIVAVALLSTLILFGCKKQIDCDPADSEAVCKAFQQCLRSDANQINANLALQQIVAQKQQQDALKAGFQDTANYGSTYQTRVAPAYNGGAQALTY